PWDREQTAASLRPFVLEETYEVLEAIEHGTPADLCEELGDFLFEAVFLARPRRGRALLHRRRGRGHRRQARAPAPARLRAPGRRRRDDERPGHREMGIAQGPGTGARGQDGTGRGEAEDD